MDLPTLEFDKSFGEIIIGVDEVGYGAWAGPVVTAAVNISNEIDARDINDSKLISSKKRNEIFNYLINSCNYAVDFASVEEINELNVLEANKKSMLRAIKALNLDPDKVLIDGNKPPSNDNKFHMVVKGDRKSLSIAAASIIAKVTRDRYMQELHENFPHYGWDSNVGYGTKSHQEGLAKFGVSPHHRIKYKPIMEILGTLKTTKQLEFF